MANQYTIGNWSDQKLAQQIEAVTSGWGTLDSGLDAWMKDSKVSSVESIDKSEEVRALFDRWLGPAYPPTDAQVKEWTTKLRNDPSANEQLVGTLRGQRLALFPSYQDESLTYEDIASPWRSVVNQVWGETADETSATFQEIVGMNNKLEAEQLLRRKGFEEGKEKVILDASSALNNAVGGSVRRAL